MGRCFRYPSRKSLSVFGSNRATYIALKFFLKQGILKDEDEEDSMVVVVEVANEDGEEGGEDGGVKEGGGRSGIEDIFMDLKGV